MLKVQVDYWTLMESKRHNQATEQQAANELVEQSRHNANVESTNWFNAYETKRTHLANEAIGRQQAQAALRSADASMKHANASMISARANQTNAETNRINAGINQQNAESNRMQANAALSNAETNAGNLRVNQVNSMVNAGTSTLKAFTDLSQTPGRIRGQSLSNQYGAYRTRQIAKR